MAALNRGASMGVDMDAIVTQPSTTPMKADDKCVEMSIEDEPRATETTPATQSSAKYRPILGKRWASVREQVPVAPPHPSIIASRLIATRLDDSSCTPHAVDRLLQRWPPSRTPKEYCDWIMISRVGESLRAPSPRRPSSLEAMRADFEALQSTKNVSVESLDEIAIKHNSLSGKWLVYGNTEQIDELWAKIVKLVCLERKHGNAKVSSNKNDDQFVICVYAEDFTDTKDVQGLREQLRTLGVRWKIGFKMDAYTHLDIYSNNKWRIRPSRYWD